MTQPITTVVTTTHPPLTNHVTVTQIETQTQTNTALVSVSGTAPLQEESEKSTPWGWVVFGLLAAGLAGAGIFWLVRRHQNKPPSSA